MMISSSINQEFSFSEVKEQFEERLKKELSFFGAKTPLRDACEYALLNGGKRIRPLIVFMTAQIMIIKFDSYN